MRTRKEVKDMQDSIVGEMPLYVPIKAAANYAGVGEDMMRAFVNSTVDPIPHIKSGKKKLIRVSAIAEYLEKKEER